MDDSRSINLKENGMTAPVSSFYYYSMVVDWVPTHAYQAEVLLFTLEKFAETPRSKMVVQCTNRVSDFIRNKFVKAGYTVASVAPYLDEKYCNKIAQLDFFLSRGSLNAEGIFLFDVDIAVLSPLDIPNREVVWGKIVDASNPPLQVLERSFAAAGMELPPLTAVDWDGGGTTVASNFNGGFLYIPLEFLAPLQASWKKWAEFLFFRPELFDTASERCHIDQMSFAMALASERIPYRHLSANWNFPCHSTSQPRTYQAECGLRVLHYHRCLDEFGLIEPEFSGQAAVAEAAKRVNTAISRREDSMFFDMYRHCLAQQAVKNIPAAKTAMFSWNFIARTTVSGQKRRLILHAGTSKTGTSSLQWHLGLNRKALSDKGLWYPPPYMSKPPKHQQLVSLLVRADKGAFAEYIESALRDMPGNTHTVILTTEGIFNHWWDYSPHAKDMLRNLAMLFDFELCVWFRDPQYFATALYAQNIRNPKMSGGASATYGRDVDFAAAMKDRWFRRHLDYLGFYYEAQCLFGESRVRAFLFTRDTVQTFMDEYGIDGLPADHRWRNKSMRRPGVEIMRIANRFHLDQKEQQRVVDLVGEIDDIIGVRSEEFVLSEEERDIVVLYAQQGWRVIKKRLVQ